jgi:hypothetical protein
MKQHWSVVLIASMNLLAFAIRAADAPAIVSNIKVLSDKVEDVSSIEALQKSIFKEGMSEQAKAVALFNTIVKFRHFEPPPQEFTGLNSSGVDDAIKLFNVYGYGSAQTAMPQLARALKYDARGYTLNKWGVAPEIFYDNSWHYLDPVMIAYYLKPDGKIPSVDEISKNVKAFVEQHPEMKNNIDAIRKFQKEQGIDKGPEMLRNGPTLEKNGSFIFNYFGWYTSMILFDGTNNTPFLYEESYSQGYRVNIQLRKGEKLTRNWSNTGLHVNMDGAGGNPELLKAETGKGVLYYTPKLGDLTNARIGNGTLVYEPPLTDSSFKDVVLSAENIDFTTDANAPVRIKDAAKPGSFVLRMPSSYVFLSGALNYEATGGEVSVAFSDDNGLSWKDAGKAAATGPQTVDLKPLVYRHYDYRLKFTLNGKDAALKSLKLSHDIQHSQRPLPALDKGENKITFSSAPSEGTITVEGTSPKFKEKHQPTLDDFHVTIANNDDGIFKQWGTIAPAGGKTTEVTVPLETPGDIARLRISCFFRASNKGEGWDMQVSFDDGKTFKTVERAAGPFRFGSRYATFTDVPKGTRKASVRFASVGPGPVIFNFRADADYTEPHGGYRPVKISYSWEENGQAMQDVHVAKEAVDEYKLNCTEKPKMKSIVLELAE